MRKQISVFLLLSAFLMFTGCAERPSEDLYLNSTAYELPLSELWALTVNETGVENESAELDQLVIRMQDSGTLEYVFLEFRGIKSGEWGHFQVRMDESGKVSWRESKVKGDFPKSNHPLPVLKVVETVGSGGSSGSGFFAPSRGLLVHADFLAGSIGYGGEPYDLYLFENGKAVPLDRIEFGSREPWCQIVFNSPGACNTTIKEDKKGVFNEVISSESSLTISEVNENGPEPGLPDHILVFLEDDLNKARCVEYAVEKTDGSSPLDLISTGCTEKTLETVALTPEPYELPLSELWDLTVNETGVENETAAFSNLKVSIGPQRSPEHILLEFWGERRGRWNFFHVEVNSRGAVSWYSSESTDSSQEAPHPLELLGEVEQVRLRELTFGEEGLYIEVDKVWRASYDGRLNNDVFVLKDGSLLPLELVRFSSAKPRYPITIGKRGYHNVLVKENKTTGESDITFLPGKEAPSFTVFTEESLSEAELLVYTEDEETVTVCPRAGYMLINNITVVPTLVPYSENRTRYNYYAEHPEREVPDAVIEITFKDNVSLPEAVGIISASNIPEPYLLFQRRFRDYYINVSAEEYEYIKKQYPEPYVSYEAEKPVKGRFVAVLSIHPEENVEKLKQEGITLKKTLSVWAIYDPEVLQNESDAIINKLEGENEIISVSFELLFR
ncbi:hypothetical protein MSMTP_0184 [Methanosarcina sp. MTP4]|uniref:hypothetical protein n=1 Tax=Methanosarcina sp. MTP4 TaxID=1434100 RepID=UPI0006155215|nr:hypothetical protein [Methanosarcina sp. MTP4]AKB23653.1 hypothetical protein MSMTP_0184 [Methanosarcina sp. MTP4]